MSLNELKQEEEHVRDEEEAEIDRKRNAARKLARRRGLSFGLNNENDDDDDDVENESKKEINNENGDEDENERKSLSLGRDDDVCFHLS